MRTRLEEQLKQLDLEIIKMGVLCEDAINYSIDALFDSGGSAEVKKKKYREVRRADDEIDQKERELEALCMKILLRQQPVASDLRMVSSVLKMISDFERIGDQASDIAELAQYITQTDLMRKLKIREMAEETAAMLTDSIDAFVNRDLERCRQVYRHDDIVDAMFDEIKKEIIIMVQEEHVDGEACVDLLMTAKYLERIADHAVNIAEWAEYSITGVHCDDSAVKAPEADSDTVLSADPEREPDTDHDTALGETSDTASGTAADSK